MTTVLSIFKFTFVATLFISSSCDNVLDESFVKSTCDFAVDLLKTASYNGEENTVISPMSVSVVLSLLQQGAGENTQVELDRVLRLDGESAKDGYEKAIERLEEKLSGVTFEWGNRAYVKKGVTIYEDFRASAAKHFKTKFEELNFGEKSPQELTDLINQWISLTTHDQIQDVIKPFMLRPDTLMLLINVMYFKGSWKNRFREKNTRKGGFEKSPSEFVNAMFMYQRNKFYIGQNKTLGVKWVELPFHGETHKMIFVLPVKRHTLDKAMKKMTGEDLMNIVRYGDCSEVRLRVPKFKIKKNYSLVDILQKMGLSDLFTEACDLHRISPETLYVSDAIHEAGIEVDEKGASASAATVVTIGRKMLMSETFRLDQPFLFFLIDSANNLPLFAGKISNPSDS